MQRNSGMECVKIRSLVPSPWTMYIMSSIRVWWIICFGVLHASCVQKISHVILHTVLDHTFSSSSCWQDQKVFHISFIYIIYVYISFLTYTTYHNTSQAQSKPTINDHSVITTIIKNNNKTIHSSLLP